MYSYYQSEGRFFLSLPVASFPFLVTVNWPRVTLQTLLSTFNILFVSPFVFAFYNVLLCWFSVFRIRCLYLVASWMALSNTFRKMFHFTNFSLTGIMLFMLLFLGVIFITSFVPDFVCLLHFCILLNVPVLSLLLALRLLCSHINNKELNWIIIPYHIDAGHFAIIRGASGK